MNSTDWAKLKDWFGAAIEASDGELATILGEAEATSPELAAELRSLLEEHRAPTFATIDASNRFISGGLNRELAPPPDPQGQIGPYRILRELGRGGAGIVFLAERVDDEFHRPVALKLLRYLSYDGRSEEALTKERRALSQLQHPNIASLVDWGTAAEGTPWLAVEYVEGQPIDVHCRERNLDVPAILALMSQVGEAIQYAHRRLIVHSDLKPANILVSEGGLVKLLDFGISKLMEGAAGAIAGQTIENRFTPAYASPEQIEGRAITAATDVYAMGLLLYELLTGQLPHSGGSLLGMVKRITDEDAPPPSQAPNLPVERRRELRGDLDRIVLHAIDRDPEKRYPSAEQFLADLQRYRSGHPLSIGSASWFYYAGKFIRRNALPVAALSVALIGLVGGTGLAVWKARVAQREQAAAEKRFHDLQQLAHSMIFEVHDSIRHLPGTIGARRSLVATAMKYLDSMQAEQIQDDSLQMELASGYYRMGYVQFGMSNQSLGDSNGGRRSYEAALRILDELWRRHPNDKRIAVLRLAVAYNLAVGVSNPADGRALAEHYTKDADDWAAQSGSLPALQSAGLIHQAIGRTMRYEGRLDESLRELDTALRLFRRLVENSVTVQMPLMVSTDVARPQSLHDMARTLVWRAAVLGELGRTKEALESYAEFRECERQALESAPGDLSFRSAVAFAHDWRSMVALQLGNVGEAVSEGRAGENEVISVSGNDEFDSSGQRNLSQMHRRIGNALCASHDISACLSELKDAVDSIHKVAEGDPGFMLNRVLEAGTLNDYGDALLRAGRREPANEAFRRAADVASRALQMAPSWVDLRRQEERAKRGMNDQ